MVDPILKVLTFFAVVILILLLLNTLGGFIAAQIPNAVWALRRIIDSGTPCKTLHSITVRHTLRRFGLRCTACSGQLRRLDILPLKHRPPRANCFAERFVRTLRTEFTDHMLIFDQQHSRVVLVESLRHYTGRRPRWP
jgi:hypothetical protein